MKHIHLDQIKKLESPPKIVNIFSEKEIKMIQQLYADLPERVFNKKQNLIKKELLRLKELKIEEKELWWYFDLRKYGTVKHSGFGLGLERLILFATGMSNIRDVIPFPRTPKNAEF